MSKNLITPLVRGSYVNLITPRAFGENEPKFSMLIPIPKGNPFLKELETEIKNKLKEKFGEVPKSYRSPLKDGDTMDEQFKGHMVFTASNKTQPGLVDANLKPVIDASEIYSGAWYRTSVSVFAWTHQSIKGVSISLQNVQKVKDDQPFGKAPTAPEDEFSAYINKSDDLLEE